MTESQVQSKYGKPDSVHISPQGQIWEYSFSPPGFLELLPGYGASQFLSNKKEHYLTVVFENGYVTTYSYSEYNSQLEKMF